MWMSEPLSWFAQTENRTKKEYIIVNLIRGSTQSSNQLSRLKKAVLIQLSIVNLKNNSSNIMLLIQFHSHWHYTNNKNYTVC